MNFGRRILTCLTCFVWLWNSYLLYLQLNPGGNQKLFEFARNNLWNLNAKKANLTLLRAAIESICFLWNARSLSAFWPAPVSICLSLSSLVFVSSLSLCLPLPPCLSPSASIWISIPSFSALSLSVSFSASDSLSIKAGSHLILFNFVFIHASWKIYREFHQLNTG